MRSVCHQNEKKINKIKLIYIFVKEYANAPDLEFLQNWQETIIIIIIKIIDNLQTPMK